MQTLNPALDATRPIAPPGRMSNEFRAAILRNHRTLFFAANAFAELPALVAQERSERLYVMIAEEDEKMVLIRAVLEDGFPPLEHRYFREFITINPNRSEMFAHQVLHDLEPV